MSEIQKRPERGVYVPPSLRNRNKPPEEIQVKNENTDEKNRTVPKNTELERENVKEKEVAPKEKTTPEKRPERQLYIPRWKAEQMEQANLPERISKEQEKERIEKERERIEMEKELLAEQLRIEQQREEEHQRKIKEAFFPEGVRNYDVYFLHKDSYSKDSPSRSKSENISNFSNREKTDLNGSWRKEIHNQTRSISNSVTSQFSEANDGGFYESDGDSDSVKESYAHLLEVYDFHEATQICDIEDIFYGYSIKIKKVDQKHAIIVLSSKKDAIEVLKNKQIMKRIPLREFSAASSQSKEIWLKHGSLFAPPKSERKTTAVVASRMISNSLQLPQSNSERIRRDEILLEDIKKSQGKS